MVSELYFPAHTQPHVRGAWPLTKQPLQILMRASFISPQVRARISCIIKSSLLTFPAHAQLSFAACYPLSYIYKYKTTLCVCSEPAGAACAFPLLCFALYHRPGRSVYVFRSALRLRNLSGGHGGVRAHHPAGAVEGPTESVVGGLHHQRNAPPARSAPRGCRQQNLFRFHHRWRFSPKACFGF
jgi:hypothetical protein